MSPILAKLSVAGVLAFCGSASQAQEQKLPDLTPVPPEVARVAPNLAIEQKNLSEERPKLQEAFVKQRQKCSAVKESNRPLLEECSREGQQLTARLQRHRAASEAFVKRLNDIVFVEGPGRFQLGTARTGFQPLLEPTWDCYCAYRYVTTYPDGPGGKAVTSSQVVRTPEQQLAFESLRELEALSTELTKARERYFSLEGDLAVLADAVVDEVKKHAAIKVGAIVVATATGATGVAAAVNVKHALELLEKALLAKAVLVDVPTHVREENQNREREVKKISSDLREALARFDERSQRAKTTTPLEHMLSQPYTITLMQRPTGPVAIVTSSSDGKNKLILRQ